MAVPGICTTARVKAFQCPNPERSDHSPATYGRRLDDFTRFHDGHQGDQPAQRKIYLLDWRLLRLQCRTGDERELSQVGVQQGKIGWFKGRQQTIASAIRSVRANVDHVEHDSPRLSAPG